MTAVRIFESTVERCLINLSSFYIIYRMSQAVIQVFQDNPKDHLVFLIELTKFSKQD